MVGVTGKAGCDWKSLGVDGKAGCGWERLWCV
jgi:hypothetical protein